jgi:phenylpyruvate tautomerase PptA (4-oxalocrotonate tautomerase family)
MPIINIKTLPSKKKINTSKILKRITTVTAHEAGYNPNHIWATWEFLQPGNYAVGDKTSKTLTKTTHSPLIQLKTFESTPQAITEKMMKKIAEILAGELNIDIGNVFIEHYNVGSGHVFDGGEVVYANKKKMN